jgi:hypothetical protein
VCELIKNLVVMINANYFFILAAESFAPQILLKINRMSGGARVFYEVLRARASSASPLSRLDSLTQNDTRAS